ncbi:Tn3 family transposase [Streptomyces chartreusis]
MKEELHQALGELEETLAGASPGDVGAVRLDEGGRLVIPPLSAEDVPAEAKALRDELSGMLPFMPIAPLLIELDARTNFLACFTHVGSRKSTQSVELKCNILAVLIAGATNLGMTRMAEACGISYGSLAWTQEWYVREANAVLVNQHSAWGWPTSLAAAPCPPPTGSASPCDHTTRPSARRPSRPLIP